MRNNKAYKYACDVVAGKIPAPRYVKKQCKEFIHIANGQDPKYMIDGHKVAVIEKLLKLLIMPKGLKAGQTVYNCLLGFQWLMIVAVLCTVHRENKKKRRYETAVLEIARKNGKTFLVAVLFLVLFFIEPRLSKFYSVAPDGQLSREVKTAIQDIISMSPALNGLYQGKQKFKLLRDSITCNLTNNSYYPLNFSTSRLDGKLPAVWVADEVGALTSPYPLDAMRSGQLTILNKLGFIISTKYPTASNPFETELDYAKKILDGTIKNDTVFGLLYEPDRTRSWADNDDILRHSNPLALEIQEVWDDLIKKRKEAVEVPARRENFLCKHCNIIAQNTAESYINVSKLQACRTDTPINWAGRQVYVGLDLSMSNDNTAVTFLTYDEYGKLLIKPMCFIPADRIAEKNALEKINYNQFIQAGNCIPCGGSVIDYSTVEEYILGLEKQYNVKIAGVGYDRYNALSSVVKLEKAGLQCVEIRQHSSILHAPTKLLKELVEQGKIIYETNPLYEINFQNCRCQYDSNMNRYINKKKSNGKIDMVIATLNALYLAQQNEINQASQDWAVQT
ncbi:putative phage-related terminase [Anaerovibrio sp. JC8]|uniref:terminase large subunit n=1 Tax=Anaerovibrio sp. JC8 TaxID=1240085 RepID=UPI000A0A970D|nr:terminase TerL endonuclease subunit [Anaerovibrio sp. JC8]ORT99657.1 putative phage-related terminase [Anaerovibrio sp. JC8]